MASATPLGYRVCTTTTTTTFTLTYLRSFYLWLFIFSLLLYAYKRAFETTNNKKKKKNLFFFYLLLSLGQRSFHFGMRVESVRSYNLINSRTTFGTYSDDREEGGGATANFRDTGKSPPVEVTDHLTFFPFFFLESPLNKT